MAKAVKKPGHSPSTGIRNRNLGTRKVRACDLVPHPLNWRAHPKSQQDALRGVLNEVGFVGTLLAYELPDGRLQLIDGHLRSDVMPNDEVDVMVTDLSESEAAKVLATHDPLAAMAEADADKLDALLRDVQTGDEALAAMLEELAQDSGVLDGMSASEVTEDEVPEPPVEPVSRTGDLWILGEHRLLCGDSTNSTDLAALISPHRADLLLTDPPYGINYKSPSGRGKTERGDYPVLHGDESPFNPAYLLDLADSCVIWGANHFADKLPPSPRWFVWDKREGDAINNNSDCELAWCSDGGSARLFHHKWNGMIKASERDEKRSHPTQKPVALIAWILTFFESAKLILDTYCGSGTTIIAAEQLKRRCFAIEISRQYVDVAVERWQRLTNREAILESTGKTFLETGRERCV